MIPECVVPYLIIIINCIFFKGCRKIIFPITPRKFRIFVSEYISTIELCATIAETGVVWAKHGDLGCSTAILLCCLWWAAVFEDAEAAPFGLFEEIVLYKQSFTSLKVILPLSAQILAAATTVFYTQSFWCFHWTEEHETLHMQKCEAALQVSVVYGMLIEFGISFISRFVALQSTIFSERIAAWMNAITTTILCKAALDTTGGFFNPILASALTLNCVGNNLIEHFMVYWVAALLGGLTARYLHVKFIKILNKKTE
ncbi:aquaporin-12-like protein [Leptotrombidium deliense]|uniref:Aquaporin-12-like protein n=1 Tax=Leptotrombidium deliense TaxID=299467 RepID=A0A443SVG9_9ACAR|nr:aquaporin-12-like protein [Leptotrombidium deliense]